MPSAEELPQKYLALKAENGALRTENAWYKKQFFGRTSEKLPADSPKRSFLEFGGFDPRFGRLN
jgi:hypothetical protein